MGVFRNQFWNDFFLFQGLNFVFSADLVLGILIRMKSGIFWIRKSKSWRIFNGAFQQNQKNIEKNLVG